MFNNLSPIFTSSGPCGSHLQWHFSILHADKKTEKSKDIHFEMIDTASILHQYTYVYLCSIDLALPNFGDSLLFMRTSFDAELPNLTW